jgi:hypothetical protein
MNKLSPFLLGLAIAATGSSRTAAQESSIGSASMPKVLQIAHEYTRPGKGGAAHDKTESAFVQTNIRAKILSHYFALSSMSGQDRALFLTGYDSFAAWQRDNDAVGKNKALGAELDREAMADGELLQSTNTVIYTYSEDLSYKPRADLSHARYMEISVFRVRPGHEEDWHKLAKIVKDAHAKAGTSAHWAMYKAAYGVDDGTYITLSADNSMADIDTGYNKDKRFREALREDGMKNFAELFGATVESSHSELFAINPRQSYPPDEWIKADPDFWKPKATAPTAKPAAAAEKKPTP